MFPCNLYLHWLVSVGINNNNSDSNRLIFELEYI